MLVVLSSKPSTVEFMVISVSIGSKSSVDNYTMYMIRTYMFGIVVNLPTNGLTFADQNIYMYMYTTNILMTRNMPVFRFQTTYNEFEIPCVAWI